MLALGCAAAELGVRALGIAPPPMPVVQGRVITDSPDGRLRFDNLPGGVQRVAYRDTADGPERVAVAHVNAHGMRGEDVELARTPGSLRIACIGDSHTFGYGVSDGETWPDVLRASLRRRAVGRTVEVLNFGVNAYDTEQEVVQLEQRVLEYQPDVVLLGFYLNDTALRELPASESAEPGYWVRILDRRQGGWIGWLRGHSRLCDLVADSLHRRISSADFARTRSAGFAPDHPGWLRVQAALRRAQALTQARHVRLGVVLIPFLIRMDGALGSHAAFEVVQQFCRSAELPCLDLEPRFDGLDLSQFRVHLLDYHASAPAYRVIGEGTADWLVARGWVEP